MRVLTHCKAVANAGHQQHAFGGWYLAVSVTKPNHGSVDFKLFNPGYEQTGALIKSSDINTIPAAQESTTPLSCRTF